MHQGEPYGFLVLPTTSEQKDPGKDTGKDILYPVLPPVLARMVGASLQETEALLGELEAVGVFSRTPEGVIFSRRMVRDEELRQTRATGGFKSLNNPKVPKPKADKDSPKDHQKDTFGVSLPPSFGGSPSSSSSSSKKEESPSFKDEFTELEYARKFWDELGIPSTPSTLTTAAQAIRLVADREECSLEVAGERVLVRAQAARKAGKKVNSFWFTDGGHLVSAEGAIGLQPVSAENSLAARNRRERQ